MPRTLILSVDATPAAPMGYTVDSRAWSDAATVASGVDETNLAAIVVSHQDAATAVLRLRELAALTSKQARLFALAPGGVHDIGEDGIETALPATLPDAMPLPPLVLPADPAEGGEHSRVGGGRHVPWDKLGEALGTSVVDERTGLQIVDVDGERIEP